MNDLDKKVLLDKVGKFGLTDLRKLAPIGDLGYMNGWEEKGIEWQIYQEFWKQGFKVDHGYSDHWTGTLHTSHNKELGVTWRVDSSG